MFFKKVTGVEYLIKMEYKIIKIEKWNRSELENPKEKMGKYE